MSSVKDRIAALNRSTSTAADNSASPAAPRSTRHTIGSIPAAADVSSPDVSALKNKFASSPVVNPEVSPSTTPPKRRSSVADRIAALQNKSPPAATPAAASSPNDPPLIPKPAPAETVTPATLPIPVTATPPDDVAAATTTLSVAERLAMLKNNTSSPASTPSTHISRRMTAPPCSDATSEDIPARPTSRRVSDNMLKLGANIRLPGAAMPAKHSRHVSDTPPESELTSEERNRRCMSLPNTSDGTLTHSTLSRPTRSSNNRNTSNRNKMIHLLLQEEEKKLFEEIQREAAALSVESQAEPENQPEENITLAAAVADQPSVATSEVRCEDVSGEEKTAEKESDNSITVSSAKSDKNDGVNVEEL